MSFFNEYCLNQAFVVSTCSSVGIFEAVPPTLKAYLATAAAEPAELDRVNLPEEPGLLGWETTLEWRGEVALRGR